MQNTCLHCLHFFGLAGTVACFAVLHIRKHLECDKETPSHTIAYIYIYTEYAYVNGFIHANLPAACRSPKNPYNIYIYIYI